MDKLNVIFCGCVRNNNRIYEILTAVYKSNILFNSFKVIIYENDSTDNTLHEINKFKNTINKENLHIISENTPITCYTDRDYYNTYHIRPINISHGRNKIIEFIENNYSHYDIMIMADLDNVLYTFDHTKLHLLFKHLHSFDVITANSMGKYYDIWALRINQDLWDDNIHGKIWKSPLNFDCWDEHFRNFNNKIKDYQVAIPTNFPLIPVNSAFGGIGIYKISKIINCRYNAFNSDIITCEHVNFHKEITLKNNATICICPEYLVYKTIKNTYILSSNNTSHRALTWNF
tara:strand:- start:452 stop:1318 length:867 start_codon:yes stop_codon:yes gene_type:complete